MLVGGERGCEAPLASQNLEAITFRVVHTFFRERVPWYALEKISLLGSVTA
jgi:hypothetical protein